MVFKSNLNGPLVCTADPNSPGLAIINFVKTFPGIRHSPQSLFKFMQRLK